MFFYSFLVMAISLVAALGNPGRAYVGTRHNIGWELLDAWAAPLNPTFRLARDHHAELAKVTFDGRVIWLAKPQTFMNDSGKAVQSLWRFFKIAPREALIIYDELQLPLGQLKVSTRGSAGGHNGVASVIEHGGTEVIRLRLGIGNRPDRRMDLKSWVLGRFTSDERAVLGQAMPDWQAALSCLLTHGPEETMQRYHQKPAPVTLPESDLPDAPATS